MENSLPKRKPLRLKNHNYNAEGSCFITICTSGRRKILSTIEKDSNDIPFSKLSDIGRIVDTVINTIPLHLGVEIDSYVIMPNHIHIIVVVINEEDTEEQKRTKISKTVGYIKMQSSKRIHDKHGPMKIWQRNYNDHVVRNMLDYDNIKSYIYYNPLRWKNDCFYSNE